MTDKPSTPLALPLSVTDTYFSNCECRLEDSQQFVIARVYARSHAEALVTSVNGYAALQAQLAAMTVMRDSAVGHWESAKTALIESSKERVALKEQLAALQTLVAELSDDFINIVVGGCTCGTKPPDPALHELNCHYRMAEAGLARIAALASLNHQKGQGHG